MRLAILHPSFTSVGGAENLALSQARCLRALGHDVTVVTASLDPATWRDRLDGLPVTLISDADWFDRVGGRVLQMPRQAARLSRALASADVAIAHNYPMSRVLAITSTSARKVWYCNEPNREVHLKAANPILAALADDPNNNESEAVQSFLKKRKLQANYLRLNTHRISLERKLDLASVGKIEVLCAISNYARLLATRTYGPRQFQVVSPIVSFPDRESGRAGLNRTELRVLVHSRLEPPKNVDTILRGFARFSMRRRLRAVLHVVGEGTSRSRLQELATELGVQKVVKFHGFLPEGELSRIYEICEVFALLPIDEPFGMVFPEAAARGLIMLGPNHGGPYEITEEGRLGFACDALCPESIAEAFARIAALSDREVDTLRRECNESCRARFSSDPVGKQMQTAYGLLE